MTINTDKTCYFTLISLYFSVMSMTATISSSSQFTNASY